MKRRAEKERKLIQNEKSVIENERSLNETENQLIEIQWKEFDWKLSIWWTMKIRPPELWTPLRNFVPQTFWNFLNFTPYPSRQLN